MPAGAQDPVSACAEQVNVVVSKLTPCELLRTLMRGWKAGGLENRTVSPKSAKVNERNAVRQK